MFFRVHDAAATRGQYLALSKAERSCFRIVIVQLFAVQTAAGTRSHKTAVSDPRNDLRALRVLPRYFARAYSTHICTASKIKQSRFYFYDNFKVKLS